MCIIQPLVNLINPNPFLFQDSNGVIGLIEPLKTSNVPVKLPVMETVVKIASGKKWPSPAPAFLCVCTLHINI